MAAEDFDSVEANAGTGGALFAMDTFTDLSGDTRVMPFSAIVIPDGAGYSRVGASNPLPVTGPLTDTQLRAAAVPVSGTFYQATQPISAAALPLPSGAGTADNQVLVIAGLTALAGYLDGVEALLGTPVLPTGAASAAKQDTEIASLASLDGKTPALGQALAAASVPVVLTASQLSTLTPLATVAVTGVSTSTKQDTIIAGLSSIDGHIDGVEGSLTSIDAKITAVNTGAVVVASSALPTGAATAARQDTGNASVASIDSKTPALGQALAAASVPVVLTAAQISTLTPLSSVSISGTVTVGSHEVTNAGTFAVQVDGSALTALQLIDDVIFTDDAAFTPGTSKVAAIGMQADETATDSVDEGDIGCPRMTLDRKQIVTDLPHTAGGLTSHKTVSAASTNATSVKNSAGQLYEIMASNVNAAARYLKLYNKASAPTVGTDTPVWTLIIPGNTAGGGIAKSIPKGLEFSTGIAFALTTEATDAGTTGVAANELVVNLGYK